MLLNRLYRTLRNNITTMHSILGLSGFDAQCQPLRGLDTGNVKIMDAETN